MLFRGFSKDSHGLVCHYDGNSDFQRSPWKTGGSNVFLVEEVLLGPDDGDVVPQLTVVVLRMEIHLEVEDVKNTWQNGK